MSPRIENPIIIIGNGGSGSTLLDRTLGCHPAIDMKGEMKFLLPIVWSAFSRVEVNSKLSDLSTDDLALYFDSDPTLETRIKHSPDSFKSFLARLESDTNTRKMEELVRRAAIFRQAMAGWFRIETSKSDFWGFKEITNTGDYDWDVYDSVFSGATWVHIVRHPVPQITAALRLRRLKYSEETYSDLLRTWLAGVETSQRRETTGRFIEIRYEDLCTSPKQTLMPLLSTLGLQWCETCISAFTQQWGDKSKQTEAPPQLTEEVCKLTGLSAALRRYGYQIDEPPDETALRKQPIAFNGGRQGELIPPFFNESGNCWQVNLSNERLLGIADDLGNWERSSLKLFENLDPLGPSHSLHYQIRRDGHGRYCHWQSRLLFSTSDNTNPNENGRSYRFEF